MPKPSSSSGAMSPSTKQPNQEIGVSVPDSETVTEDKKKQFTVRILFIHTINKL